MMRLRTSRPRLSVPSGDDAWVSRTEDVLWLAGIDGVGHGSPAEQAASRARAWLQRQQGSDPVALLEALHAELRRTRGAAITLARWDLAADELVVAGVGNVAARLYTPDGHLHGMMPTSGILGHRWISTPRIHRVQTTPRSVLVLATDGIASRSDPVPPIVGRSAAHIAQIVVAQAAKEHDDALVIVAR